MLTQEHSLDINVYHMLSLYFIVHMNPCFLTFSLLLLMKKLLYPGRNKDSLYSSSLTTYIYIYIYIYIKVNYQVRAN